MGRCDSVYTPTSSMHQSHPPLHPCSNLESGPAQQISAPDIVTCDAANPTGVCKRYGWRLAPGTLSWRATAERHSRFISALKSGCE